MSRSSHVGGEPIAQPSDICLRSERVGVKCNRGEAAGGAVFRCAPVDQLGLGDREGEAQPFCPPGQGLEPGLKDLDVPPVGGGHGGERKIVYKREGVLGARPLVKGGHIQDKKQWRYRGSLGGSNRHVNKIPGGTLEGQPARTIAQEGPDPGRDVWGDTFLP